jgi:tRNA(Arg) A34 adenosine deaminase TadA
MKHDDFIREAIRISRENMENGGGPFGAVIVRDGEIIARAGNGVTTRNDPTAHAEINAIRQACKKLDRYDLSGCVLYSSCEPCPMCLGAIYWARLDGIWFAADRHDAAEAGFDDSFIYREITKPLDQRNIPTHQHLRDEAVKTFEQWIEKEDKIQY